MDNNKTTFRNKVKSKFNPQITRLQVNNKRKKTAKPTFISPLPPPIPAKSQKEVNEISKYFKKSDETPQKKSYTQASSQSKLVKSISSSSITMDTLKIKEMFPNLSNKKIDIVQKVINGDNSKPNPKINMTMKGPSHKQVIVPINNKLAKRFLKDLSMHIININHALKNILSNMIADFIRTEDKGTVITTNNISLPSDLQKIKKYIKNSFTTDVEHILSPRLPQSKSYLIIIGIHYISKRSNIQISSDEIENILKNNHIFNNIILVSKPWVIKVLPKSDMAIIWIDIWDIQNGSNARKIINRCFNIRSFIATVHSANINPGVPQCKDCWKWGHTASVCCIQGAKCVKCNGPHLTAHHCYFVWYCKANNKINPPRLETKKGKPCPHTFKCLNCKGDHQADSIECLFWKHHFNKKWYYKTSV